MQISETGIQPFSLLLTGTLSMAYEETQCISSQKDYTLIEI